MNPVAATGSGAAAIPSGGQPRAPSLVSGVAPTLAFRAVLAQASCTGATVSRHSKAPALVAASRQASALASGLPRPVVTEVAARAPRSRAGVEPFDEGVALCPPIGSPLSPWLLGALPQQEVSGAPGQWPRPVGSLEELLPALVRKIAWSGDGKRGTARLEISSGELAGATLLVEADGGRVRVTLDTPPGTDVASWRERIVRRLASRSIVTDQVDVS